MNAVLHGQEVFVEKTIVRFHRLCNFVAKVSKSFGFDNERWQQNRLFFRLLVEKQL